MSELLPALLWRLHGGVAPPMTRELIEDSYAGGISIPPEIAAVLEKFLASGVDALCELSPPTFLGTEGFRCMCGMGKVWVWRDSEWVEEPQPDVAIVVKTHE